MLVSEGQDYCWLVRDGLLLVCGGENYCWFVGERTIAGLWGRGLLLVCGGEDCIFNGDSISVKHILLLQWGGENLSCVEWCSKKG